MRHPPPLPAYQRLVSAPTKPRHTTPGRNTVVDVVAGDIDVVVNGTDVVDVAGDVAVGCWLGNDAFVAGVRAGTRATTVEVLGAVDDDAGCSAVVRGDRLETGFT